MSVASAPVRAPEPFRHRVLALPSTRQGRWAAALFAALLAGIVIEGLLVVVGVPDWGWGGRLVLGLSGAIGIVAGVSAGVLAVVAVIKGERSIVLLAPLLMGALAAMFVLGEILMPH